MSEVKKLSEEDLQTVRAIKREYEDIAFSLGDVVIQKTRLLDAHKRLAEKEFEIAKQLQEKYGTGNINLETGEITPGERNTTTRPLPN